MPRRRRTDYRSRHLRTRELVRIAERRWRDMAFWHCVYCGRLGTTVDHFKPLAKGGTDDPMNLVPACAACNSNKADAWPQQWMQLVGVPKANIAFLQMVTTDQTWRARPLPPGHRPPRVSLDYEAYTYFQREIERHRAAERASSGQKGEFGGAFPFIP